MPFGIFGKIIGGVSLIIGLSIVIGFPWVRQFQPGELSNAGVLLGIILIGVGLYLILV